LEALRETLKANLLLYKMVYDKGYETITTRRNEGDAWPTLFSSVIYQDDPPSNEIMVRLVEAENKTTVKNAKHLQKLTGIDPELIDELEDTLTKARDFRYMRVLDYAVAKGAKYKDLLTIEPKTFGLPEKWKGFLREDTDKEKAIGEALYFHSSSSPLFHFTHKLQPSTLKEIEREAGLERLAQVKLECFGSGLTTKEKAEFYEAPFALMLDAKSFYDSWRK